MLSIIKTYLALSSVINRFISQGLVKKRLLPFYFSLDSSNISSVADFSFLDDNLKQKFIESDTAVALSLDGTSDSEDKRAKPGSLHAEDGSAVGVILGQPLLVPSIGMCTCGFNLDFHWRYVLMIHF